MSFTSQASPATLRSVVISRPTALTQAALVLGGTGFLAVMAQIALPIPGSPVPVTGQTLGALLLGTAYGASLGFTTFITYLAIGIAGAPIFASGSHGIHRLSGATGGYLFGMLLASFVTGLLAKRAWDRKLTTSVFVMVIGEIVIFASGLIWLHHVAAQSWSWTISKGFTPFILGEVLKIAIASTALPLVWRLVPAKKQSSL
jgi:biotin transport system substrate-specific component